MGGSLGFDEVSSLLARGETARQEYVRIIDSLPVGVGWLVRRRIVAANGAFCRLLDIDVAQLSRLTIDDCLSRSGSPELGKLRGAIDLTAVQAPGFQTSIDLSHKGRYRVTLIAHPNRMDSSQGPDVLLCFESLVRATILLQATTATLEDGKSVRSALSDDHFDIIEVTDSMATMAAIEAERRPIDLVVLDLTAPPLNQDPTEVKVFKGLLSMHGIQGLASVSQRSAEDSGTYHEVVRPIKVSEFHAYEGKDSQMQSILTSLLLSSTLALPAGAGTIQLVTNGGFESGFASWTTSQTVAAPGGGCATTWNPAGGGGATNCVAVSNAIYGNVAAYTSFDG